MARFENRNLVVCETFDEFAEKVDKIDFDTEDIVGLVTSLANVYYWLNVESIWGPLGFTWKVTDDYGVFNTTTVPFTIIPKLPDGERIKQLNNTFNSVSSDYIELKKSNWENLCRLDNPWQNKIVKADLTGAKLTFVSNLLYWNKTPGDGEVVKGLYIKADFSNVGYLYGSVGKRNGNDFECREKWVFLEIDDENKGMNAPNCKGCYLWWSGEGEFKLEYFFREEGLQNYSGGSERIYIYAENGKLSLTNVAASNIRLIGNRFVSYTEWNASAEGYPTTEETPIELTIDGRINPVIQIRDWFGYNNRPHKTPYYMKPIKLVNYESIDWINPYCMVRDEWPELPDEELEKWEDSTNSSFMPYVMVESCKLVLSCPYTIDASNRKYLKVFDKTSKECWAYFGNSQEDWIAAGAESIGSNKAIADILPKITGFDHTFEEVSFPGKCLAYLSDYYGSVFYKLPNCTIKTKVMNSMSGFYMDENTVIECSIWWHYWSYTSVVYHDTSTVHWRLVPNEEGKMRGCSFVSNYGGTILNPSDDINYIELGTHDEAVLKASNIDTFDWRPGKNFKQDIVVCNGNLSLNNKTITIESEFIYIYASNFSITCGEGYTSYETIKKLIDGLVKDESGTQHSVTLKSWIYSQLTDDEKSHIINDLGYTLVEQK